MNIKSTSFVVVFLFCCHCILPAQTWERCFVAGNTDINGKYMGGSEVLHLVTHKNALYAAVGYWEDGLNIWYGGSNADVGWGQVLSLDSPDGNWKVDMDMGGSHLRPEILRQVVFTKDGSGNLLSIPDTLLIAATYSQEWLLNTVSAHAFTRDDVSGSWEQSLIFEGGFPAGEEYSVRDMQVYTDQVTGVEKIFISVGRKGIFTGVYKQSAIGKIQWDPVPEIGSLDIRPLGIAEANGGFFFSSGNKIYKRNDGSNPTYSIVHDFSDLSENINSAVGGIRGLSTIPNPAGSDDALILMWCPNGQSQGIIYRLEPDGAGGYNRVFEVKISQLVGDYLSGATVSYLLGAYNEFYPIEDATTNEVSHIVGFEASITGGGHPTWNGYYKGAMYAIRNSALEYSIAEVNEQITPNDTALVATRCYVKSPFGEEDVVYFGGHDPNGFLSTNMAWVYKRNYNPATLVNEIRTEQNSLKIFPCPASDYIEIQELSLGGKDFEVVSVTGQTKIMGEIYTDRLRIDISDLGPGVYIIKVGSRRAKFIKTE